MELTEQQKEYILKGRYLIIEGVGAPEVKINSAEENLQKKA